MSARRRILFDTDIGSDIDDALALLLLLHLKDVELLGVTTVYGNVGLRAKIARRILQAAGNDAPVHAGVAQPIDSGFPIWETGTEGVGLLSNAEMAMPLGDFNLGENAPAFIAEQVINNPGAVTIVCLGALSNLATALKIEPRLVDLVEHVFFMGGGVTYPEPVPAQLDPGDQFFANASHNVRCDDEAASRVFESGMKITVLTNDVTTRAWWEGVSVEELIHADDPPESCIVGKLLKVWLDYRSRIFDRAIRGTCPHDAMTVAEAVEKGRFVRYQQGRMTVHRDGSTTFVPDDKGPHSVATQVNVDEFLGWLAPRLLQRESQAPVSNRARFMASDAPPGPTQTESHQRVAPTPTIARSGEKEGAEWMAREFTFPDLAGLNVLVVGIGGGCDIISAFALAQVLQDKSPAKVVYANTKTFIREDLERVSPSHIFRVPPERIALMPHTHGYGTTLIDQSVPRGADGCPFILRLSDNTYRCAELVCELRAMDFDLIVSVDSGADSIVAEATSGPRGRDQRMMHLLEWVGLPWYHVVVSPGCDGETTLPDIVNSLKTLDAAGKYQGCFSLEPMIPVLRELAAPLSRNRTPNIIVNAFSGALDSTPDGCCLIVPRGKRPGIPREWLANALVFGR